MTRLDIYHGLLGAGKTTLIAHLLKTAYAEGRCALIENEIGKVNLDAEDFSESPLEIREITSGCACCTVIGDFSEAVRTLSGSGRFDRIIVEPSGLADARSIAEICTQVDGIEPGRSVMVVNAKSIVPMLKVSGPFIEEQIACASSIYLSRAESMQPEDLHLAIDAISEINPNAAICTKPLAEITGKEFMDGASIAENSGSHVHAPHAQSKTYSFEGAFDEARLEELMNAIACSQALRAKGVLRMEDESLLKVDYVDGEVIQALAPAYSEGNANVLVVIGEHTPDIEAIGGTEVL